MPIIARVLLVCKFFLVQSKWENFVVTCPGKDRLLYLVLRSFNVMDLDLGIFFSVAEMESKCI